MECMYITCGKQNKISHTFLDIVETTKIKGKDFEWDVNYWVICSQGFQLYVNIKGELRLLVEVDNHVDIKTKPPFVGRKKLWAEVLSMVKDKKALKREYDINKVLDEN